MKKIFKLIHPSLLLGLVITFLLLSCTSNTVSLSTLHTKNKEVKVERQLFKNMNERLIFSGSAYNIYFENQTYHRRDDSTKFTFYKSPINASFDMGTVNRNFALWCGLGLGEAYKCGASVISFQPVQFHIWGSTWLFGNDKFGYGITFNPIGNLVFGVGRATLYGYSLHQTNDGLNMVPAYDVKDYLENRIALDVLYNLGQVGVYAKSEFNDKKEFRTIEIGATFQFE